MKNNDFSMKTNLIHLKKDVQLLEKHLISPRETIEKFRTRIEKAHLRISQNVQSRLEKGKHSVSRLNGMLDSLSPLRVVDRGYSITSLNGQVVKNTSDANVGDSIEVKVSDGHFEAQVTKIIKLSKGK